jgi:molybdopterin converting factor subunit 1
VRVHVLFFARARELAGLPEADLEIPSGANVEAAARRLGEEFPGLASYLPVCRLAVDEELAAGGDPVRDGAVLAVIPPVSGG